MLSLNPDDIVKYVVAWTPVILIGIKVAVILASAINAFTTHYSRHKKWARAFLKAVEKLSFITSTDARTRVGRLKLPLQDVKPANER